jgi:hypothetical protein
MSDPQATAAKMRPAALSAPIRISPSGIAIPSLAMVPSNIAAAGAAINIIPIFTGDLVIVIRTTAKSARRSRKVTAERAAELTAQVIEKKTGGDRLACTLGAGACDEG